MKFLLSSSLVFGLAMGAAVLSPRQTDEETSNPTLPPNCRLVSFTVSGTARNRNLTGIPLDSLQRLKNFYNNAPFITTSGSQIITGTYCAATRVESTNNPKLQVLFNSILTNRGSWQAQGGLGTDYTAYNPDKYSWTQFANARGYPTLALDRLGNGRSSHPDPILVTQAAYEFAIYNDLARQLRNTNTQFPRYNFLIYVGNSYGSQIGAGIAGTYPNAFNEFVLTGYSRTADPSFPGFSLINPQPARTVDPARFGNLNPGYVTTANQTALTNSFFGSKQQVSYEDIVARYFFERRDVSGIGQIASIYAYPFSGAGFRGRVLVLTGEQDQAFCGPGSPVIGPAGCGQLLAQTRSVFPDAQYSWRSVNRTGHAIQLHDSAQTVFIIAHFFLAGVDFNGGTAA